MSTTDLLVEYLVLGAFALVWLVVAVLGLLPADAATLAQLADLADKLGAVLLLPILASTYVLGGIVNQAAALLLKGPQAKFRNQLFRSAGTSYGEARGLLYQRASADAMARFRSDGHIIRVARGSVLNFVLLSAALLLHVARFPLPILVGVVLCLVFATISYSQWRDRYRSNYAEMLDIYLTLARPDGAATVPPAHGMG